MLKVGEGGAKLDVKNWVGVLSLMSSGSTSVVKNRERLSRM